MANFINKLTRPGYLPDELASIRKSFLNVATASTAVVCSLLFLVLLAGAEAPVIRIILAGMSGLSAMSFWIGKRYALQTTGWIFTVGMLAGIMLVALFILRSPALAALLAFPLFLISGIVIGESSMIIVGSLTLVVLNLSAWNILPGFATVSETARLSFTLGSLLPYGLCYVLLGNYLRADAHTIQRLQQNEKDLFESNRELQAVRAALEEKIRAGLSSAEKKAMLLRNAAEIGHTIAAYRELSELLSQATRVISEKFGYYHVGIFLLDERGDYAILQAANSPGGLVMLEAGHHLKVGTQGIVGHVISTRQAHITLDVGEDAQHYKNPHLLDTRSEMALPLVVGEKIIGALDIQSKQPQAFTPEDKIILQLLADQLAVAIENARLDTEMETALESARKANDATHHQAWINHLHNQPLVYRMNRRGLARTDLPDLLSGDTDGEQLEQHFRLPLKIRGQVIGHLTAQKDSEQPSWSSDERELLAALIEQLSLSLDNARLYEGTQRRAERERLASEITTKLRALQDPKLIMETAAQELRAALRADLASIRPQAGDSRLQTPGEAGSGNGNKQRQASQAYPGITSQSLDE